MLIKLISVRNSLPLLEAVMTAQEAGRKYINVASNLLKRRRHRKMVTARVTICNKKGLHARAAAKLVKTAANFDAEIQVTRLPRPGENAENATAGATSILSLLMLAAEMGIDVELNGQGPQAEEAIEALKALISRRFDEEE